MKEIISYLSWLIKETHKTITMMVGSFTTSGWILYRSELQSEIWLIKLK